jgi:hypothetical protein
MASRMLKSYTGYKSLTCSSEFTLFCAVEDNYFSVNLLHAILVDSLNLCVRGGHRIDLSAKNSGSSLIAGRYSYTSLAFFCIPAYI